jgi:hypothetical protein
MKWYGFKLRVTIKSQKANLDLELNRNRWLSILRKSIESSGVKNG